MSAQNHAPASTAPVDLDRELRKGGFAHEYIRYRSRKLVGRLGFTKADIPDLQQELKLRLVQRVPQFDPSINNWHAFVIMVVRRQVTNILDDRRRQKREQYGREMSLSEVVAVEAGLPIEKGETLNLDDAARCSQEFDRSETEWIDLEHDVASALAQLTPLERQVCELLQKRSVAATARIIGLPRVTVVDILTQLRPVLAKAGLHTYRHDAVSRMSFEADEVGEESSEISTVGPQMR